jgi:hypothetical protein
MLTNPTTALLYLTSPPVFQITIHFDFSRYTPFDMHLDIYLCLDI